MLSLEARALIGNERYEDFLREAERERIIQCLPGARPSLAQQLETIAAWLSRTAGRLRAPASVQSCCTPALCC